jgi:hypothetical protein
MRNYLQTFWARTEWNFDFNPPNPPLRREQYLFSPTNEDLQEQIRLFFESLASDPQNSGMTIVRQGPVYWLMDKTNLFYSLDMSHVALKDQGFTEDMIVFKTDPDFESPRDGWKDVSGVEREAPPSEKAQKSDTRAGVSAGRSQQLTFAGFLATIVADLLAMNNATAREVAAALVRLINKLMAGTITDVKALAVARDLLKQFPTLEF